MYLVKDGAIFWDPELDLFAELASVIDRHLEAIDRESQDCPLPDEFGYFEWMEHLVGLGFAACQAYLVATYGFAHVPKPQALLLGPKHSSGRTVVEIVNHAANYWKHHDEWSLDKSPTHREQIAAAFKDIGFPVDTDYPLGNILATIADPAKAMFASLVPHLAAWREQVRAIKAG